MPREIQGAWWLDGGLNLKIIVLDVNELLTCSVTRFAGLKIKSIMNGIV